MFSHDIDPFLLCRKGFAFWWEEENNIVDLANE
jgi:hypothetical protein